MKKSLVKKKLGSKKMFSRKKFRFQNIFWSKKILGQKKFWVQKNRGLKKFESLGFRVAYIPNLSLLQSLEPFEMGSKI